MRRRSLPLAFALLTSACGGASASETPAASSGGESATSTAPSAPTAEAGVIEVHPFAFTAGPDGELLRLLEDGTIVVRGSRVGRLAADGRIVEADIDLAVDAAGEIRLGGEILARIDGARMSFVGESTTFEIVPGALEIATEGEVEERLDLEGNPPPRTALFLAVLLMYANGAAGP